MMLPDELEWVLKMLGYNWPTANEDLLRDSAALWRKFGDDAQKLRTRADTSARTVVAHNAGESIDKFTTHYKKFSDGSDGYLANASEAAYIIANTFEAAAYLVEFAKYAVIVQLIALAIQIAAAAAASIVTFGLSAAAGMAATQITRLAVRRILDALKDALMEAIIEAMKEPAVSAVQAMVTDLVRQSVNVGFGAQEGFDLSKTVSAGAKGGWEAIKQTPQTFAEGLRDGLGKKAGSSVRDGIDSGYNSSMDAFNNRNNPTAGGGDGGSGDNSGSDGSSSNGSNSSNSSTSDSNSSSSSPSNTSNSSGSTNSSGSSNSSGASNSSGSSNSSNTSDTSGSPDSSSSDSSTTSRANTNTGNTNIGGGISADADGPAAYNSPDLGNLPNTDTGSGTPDSSPSTSDTGQNPSSSNSPSRPTLSDFDDPSPSNTSPSPSPSSDTSSNTPSAGDNRGGSSSPGGLTSPTPQSAPTPTAGGTPSSTSSGGSISTSIDSLAASIPTQSNAAPTPTTADPSASAGPRPDGNSSMPTSPTPPSTADGGAGARTGTNTTPSGSPSGTSATSPNPSQGPPRTSATPGTPNPTGTGPASTPSPTPSTPPRNTPAPSTDGRTPGATPGPVTSPNQNTPSGAGTRTPGSQHSTPGTGDGRTPNQNTTGSTGGRPSGQTPTTPNSSDGRSPDTNRGPSRTTPNQGPGSATPNQDPRQPAPPRNAAPQATQAPSPSPTATPSTANTPASGSPGRAPDRAPTPSTNTPNTSQPAAGNTPARPHQPSGSSPSTPQQPSSTNSGTPSSTPNQQQVTAVPIHTVVPGPNAPAQSSNPTPSGPQPPGSPQADPGAPDKPEPKTDSLDDIRNDLDHHPGGLTEPDPQDQQLLADAVPQNPDGTPQRFPDPFGPWSQLQNDGGNQVPGRSNNCADCSRSFLETWRGNPQVSAPRTLDTDENGNVDPWSPEDDANENQIRWSGAPHSYAGEGSDPDTAQRIADDLLQAGHGAHAIVQVDWPGGGGHAFNAVNHNGQVVWIDTQSGEVSHDPLHIPNAEHVWHIPMDPDGNPLHPATAEDTDDSQNTNDESQTDNSENAENSDSSGQPDNSTQNDASVAPPKQQTGSDDPSTESPSAADSAASDASTTSSTPQPSAVEPSTAPDAGPANAKAETQGGQTPQPSSTPDDRQTTSENGDSTQPRQSENAESASEPNRPSPSETPDTRDPQSRQGAPTHSDAHVGAPDTASQPPAPASESPTRTASPSDHQQQPTHDTQDTGPAPTRTAAETSPNRPTQGTSAYPTPDRDTPQQTTTPPDPRTSVSQQQTADPRTADPRRGNPTRQKPETGEQPDGRRPNTPPRGDQAHLDQLRPDQARPDHREQSPAAAPDKNRPDAPDPTRHDDPNQSPADNHRDRPSTTNKDSAVPPRESLPDGRNADASSYVRDSTRGKDLLYGPIAEEAGSGTNRPDSDSTAPPRGPSEPAARSEEGKAFIRRMVDFANESRENRKKYWQKNGNRHSLDDRVDGQRLPQLKPDPDHPDDPDKFIAASDVPPPDAPDYMPQGIVKPVKLGRDDGQIAPQNLENLDAQTNDREWTLQADRIAETAKLQAKKDHGEDSEEYKAAKRVYADTHSAVRDIGESHGENAALHHAMASQHPEYVLVDVPHTGNGSDQFDQIYEDPNKPGHYIVVEAKAPTGQLGERKGHTGQKVMQGTREYFETIYMLMQDGTPEQQAIANKLETAYELGNVQYVLVQSKVESDPEANAQANNGNHESGYVGDDGHRDRKRYGGSTMDYFDIRKPEDRQQ
ncbi:toxin glutamine deamidase domain-containing protein [Streptomyces sp. NPDC055287]